ncbi:HAD family hydrolase [Sharpea azabuensis]|uniref:HAD family hydrolase n=1 Tax=Sharpea porci TaxID=2652286 RepID=A0A844FV81_9FIRM|nr:HAD family hydrolase [Sharpea porci]MST89991.1 HAD family hydrolase [Sharpea porci]
MSAIFFDIDGTIFDGKEIHQEVIQAIQATQAKGHYCFIASGRPRSFISDVVLKIGFDGYILANGATILFEEKTLSNMYLPQEPVKQLLDYCDDQKIEYILLTKNAGYLRNNCKYLRHFYPMAHVDTSDFITDFNNKDVLDHLVKIELHPETEEQYNMFKKILGEEFFIMLPAGSGVAEVSRRDVDKGTAIRNVLQYLNLSLSDSYAFGDGANDIGMFEAVGHPIAMANASDDVKRQAEYICESVYDNGVAKELKRLFL